MLVDAALELLGTEGAAGTSVRAVCAAARLNPRYFYESFADLEALIVAVYDRLVTELGAAVFAAATMAKDDPAEQVRAMLDTVLRFVEDDPRRGRVLYVEALGSESLNRRRVQTAHALVGLVEKAGAQRNGSLPAGEPIGGIAAAILVGGAGEMVISWLDGRIVATRQQLVDDATQLFIGIGRTAARIAAGRMPPASAAQTRSRRTRS